MRHNVTMEWVTAIVSVLGTSGVTAIIASLTAPRSEAKRLRLDIAANSVAAKQLLSGSDVAIVRAANADGFRLAALTLVRFETWLSVLSGLVAIIAVASAGAVLIVAGSPGGDSLQEQVTVSFAIDPLGSSLVVAGVLLAGVALGSAIWFIRSQMLRSARTAYVREQLALLNDSHTLARAELSRFVKFWHRFHSRATDIFFTRD